MFSLLLLVSVAMTPIPESPETLIHVYGFKQIISKPCLDVLQGFDGVVVVCKGKPRKCERSVMPEK